MVSRVYGKQSVRNQDAKWMLRTDTDVKPLFGKHSNNGMQCIDLYNNGKVKHRNGTDLLIIYLKHYRNYKFLNWGIFYKWTAYVKRDFNDTDVWKNENELIRREMRTYWAGRVVEEKRALMWEVQEKETG